jgi:hypothetical protein
VVTPGQRRAAITHAKRTAAISERRSYRFLGIHRSLVVTTFTLLPGSSAAGGAGSAA